MVFEATFKTMAKNKKRANEGAGASSAAPPPLKRQKIVAASSSTAVSDATAARIRQLEQRLQSAEKENARLKNLGVKFTVKIVEHSEISKGEL